MDYYKALAAAAREYGTAFYDEVLAGADPDAPSGTERVAEDDEHPVLTLTGGVGAQAAATFTLENHDPETAVVSLEAGVCRGPAGEAFAPSLRIEPSSLSIPPGETAKVTVAVDLAADHFVPNVGYRMPLHVRGPRPATVDVTIVATDVRDASTDAIAGEPPDDIAAGEPPAQEGTTGAYVVECPACRRRFERKTDSVRLRAHKTPEGRNCPEREGRRPRR